MGQNRSPSKGHDRVKLSVGGFLTSAGLDVRARRF